MKMQFKAIAFAAAALAMGQAAWAGEAEAKKWIDSEFQPSTLSKDQQMAEMKWFIDAAKKLQAKGVKEISSFPKPSPRTSTNPRRSPRRLRKSLASRSSTT